MSPAEIPVAKVCHSVGSSSSYTVLPIVAASGRPAAAAVPSDQEWQDF